MSKVRAGGATPEGFTLEQELEAYRSLYAAVAPFVGIMMGTSGRIPTERLSHANWHALAKAYERHAPQPAEESVGLGIYVASRVSRAPMWKALRDTGVPITSSWIDEAGEGDTASFSELWMRLHKEINESAGLIFYGDVSDAPWKGALVEVGIALGLGKLIGAVIVGDVEGRTYRPIGSWLEHPSVFRFSKLNEAVDFFHRSPK